MLKLTPINIVIAIFTFDEIKHNSWYNLPYGEYNWQIFCYFEPEKKRSLLLIESGCVNQ